MADSLTRAARSARIARNDALRTADRAHGNVRSWIARGAKKKWGRIENLRNVVQTLRNETAQECCG